MSTSKTQKNTEEFENMVRSYLEKSKDPLFGVKTRDVSPELEIRFGINKKQSKPLSKIDYDNVVHQLLLNGWKTDNIEGTQMLRIANEFYDARHNEWKNKPKPAVEEEKNAEEATDAEKKKAEVLTDDPRDYYDGGGAGNKVTTKMKMSGTIRYEIVGADLIQDYCKTNSADYLIRNHQRSHRQMKFTEKLRIKDDDGKELKAIDYFDYNFRVAYKAEKDTSIKTENPKFRNILLNWNNTRKYFRLLNRVRFYHPEYPVFVDISIIKTNKTIKVKRTDKDGGSYQKDIPLYAHTVQECTLFENPATYEIELEIDNRTAKNYEFAPFMVKLRKSIRFILSGLQQTPYPVSYSEQEEILHDYMERMFGDSWKETKRPHPFFLGPNPVTLQLENVVQHVDEESDLKSALPQITDLYTVTEKADGLRTLLYVSKKGKLYMIDGNMKVKFTGSVTKEKTCFDSLLDGEFIMYDKKQELLYMYAAFDIYYIGGRNKLAHVRDLDFCSKDPLDTDENYRLPLLQKFVSVLQLEPVVPNSTCRFQVQAKTFECHYEGTQDIFQASKQIWSKRAHAYPYEIDGLIYTPMCTGVGGDASKKASELKRMRWERAFKWKPHNTIDFLVEVMQKDGKDLIQHLVSDDSGHQKIVQYKTLILRCGFNTKEVSMNPFQDMLQDKVPDKKSKSDVHHNDSYKPFPFQPTTPNDDQAHLCYVPLETDAMGNLQMITEETKEAFQNYMIVEFDYARDDTSRNGPWKWVPLRVRYDKTARLANNENEFGNNFDTANNNWRAIHFPVTDRVITGEEMPSAHMTQELVYYSQAQKNSKTKALRDFHNLYVKNKLIAGVAGYLRNFLKILDPLLIDYSVGEGGDMAKWRNAKVRFVLGIDISRSNIMNRQKGACMRYLTHRRDFTDSSLRGLFVHGNSGLNIRNQGKAFYDTMTKELVMSAFGSGKNTNKIQKVYEHGIARDGFHISSCQFSMHYFFQNNTTLHHFLRNLAECTRVHGYFVGTCFDGQKVFDLLKQKKENESIRIDKDGNKIFEIMKGYSSSIKTLPEGKESVGMTVHVFQESINAMFAEYLVNFTYFVQLMEDYGFVLIDKKESEKMGFTDSNGLFDQLFRKMTRENYQVQNEKEYLQAPNMTHHEQTISFLNRYFIFKKVRDLSESSLRNMEKDLDEKQEEEEDEKESAVVAAAAAEEKKEQSVAKENDKDKKDNASEKPKKRRQKIANKRIKITSDNYSPAEET